MAWHWKKQEAGDIPQKQSLIQWYTDTVAQAESLHNLQQAATGIGLCVNPNHFFIWHAPEKGGLLHIPWQQHFLYRHDVNLRISEAWAAMNRLSAIWKTTLVENVKCIFFLNHCFIRAAVWMHYMDTNKGLEKRLIQGCSLLLWICPGSSTLLSSSYISYIYISPKSFEKEEQGLRHTAGAEKMNL